MIKNYINLFRQSGRPYGLFLAGSCFFLISTDSLLTRISDTDGWTIAFFVGVWSIPVMLIIVWQNLGDNIASEISAHKFPLFISSTLAAIGTTSFIQAVTRTEVANVVAIIAGAPIFSALIARLFIKEETSKRTWLAIIAAFTGILIIVWGSLGSGGLDGNLIALLSILTFSTNIVIWRHHQEIPRSLIVLISAFIIAVTTFVPALPLELDRRSLICTILMGLIFGPVARLCMVSATRYASASEVSMFAPVETICATIWVWIWFDEVPSTSTFIGGFLVLAAVFYGITQPRSGKKLKSKF